MLVRPALIAASLVASFALAGCGDDDSPTTASDPTPSASDEGGACDYAANGQPASKEVEPPPATPTATGQVAATIATNRGDIPIELDADTTPCTVNSFLSLAEQGYYDDTPCHRLVDGGIHVLQCGDPSGTGTGGPGYAYADELTGSESYPAGTLAMANAGPDTNGSQFFIVYGETPLPPDYTVFGTVDADGIKVVEKIADKGTANGQNDGPPAQPVTITSVSAD